MSDLQPGSVPIAVSDAHRVLALLDARPPEKPARSCMSAALGEARVLTGREVIGGVSDLDNEHRLTCAGALVYFVVMEQVGSCFHPLSAWPEQPPEKTGLYEGMVWFGAVEHEVAAKLQDLRNRFAHDYSLEPPKGGERFVLHGEPGPLYVRKKGRPWVSLFTLAETAEQVVAEAKRLAVDGELGVHHIGGLDRVEARFTMQFGDADAMPSGGRKT